MLVDSEDPVVDGDRTWNHLKSRDNWSNPIGAVDEQVILMTTCMETWIAADRETLKAHYGNKLQENALPPLIDLESRNRQYVLQSLVHATRNCSNAYAKGKRSFEIVGVLRPTALRRLAAYARMEKVLEDNL